MKKYSFLVILLLGACIQDTKWIGQGPLQRVSTHTVPIQKQLIGTFDLGNGIYEVHDYKTNNSLPKQQKLDEDRQLAMYSLWVKLNFKDCKKVRLVWHFLAFDKEMDSFRTICYRFL